MKGIDRRGGVLAAIVIGATALLVAELIDIVSLLVDAT